MGNRVDRVTLRKAIAAQWPVDPADLKTFYDEAKAALTAAKKIRDKNSCLRTLQAIIGQLQAAQEWEAKESRLDSGDPTEITANAIVVREVIGG